jgi:hypothetical protein
MRAVGTYPEAYIRPLGFRIFGTLNSTHPFGAVVMTSALMGLATFRMRHMVASAPAFLALLLSWSRTSWGGWAIGALFTYRALNAVNRRRIRQYLAGGAFAAVIVLSATSFGPRFIERAATLGNLTEDGSFKARLRLYGRSTLGALLQPIGQGIGSIGTAAKLSTGSSVNLDSGFLTLMMELGWVGTLPYLWGLVVLFKRALMMNTQDKPIAASLVAVTAAFMAMMFLSNEMVAIKGLLFWTSLGAALGGDGPGADPSA